MQDSRRRNVKKHNQPFFFYPASKTRVRARASLRFLDRLRASDLHITIRPSDFAKCKMGASARDVELISAMYCTRWMSPSENHFELSGKIESRIKRQIDLHEKKSKPVEMYRIEFTGFGATDDDASATEIAVDRANVLEGKATVIVDKVTRKVWAHSGIKEPGRWFTGMLRGLSKRLLAGLEDPLSTYYLRIC